MELDLWARDLEQAEEWAEDVEWAEVVVAEVEVLLQAQGAIVYVLTVAQGYLINWECHAISNSAPSVEQP